MVEFGIPYAVDDSRIPGVDLREDTQRKVGSGSGVSNSGDLKILPLNTPGAGVQVVAGGSLVQCRAAGRERETYSLSNRMTQDYLGDGGIGLPGTGSGAKRSDMIILEILDPTFAKWFTPKESWPVGQFAKISVVQGVPETATSVDKVPALANVTAYALARIDYPASTATVTAAMIKDLRKLQAPKTSVVPIEYSLVSGETSIVTNTSGYPNGQTWPSQADAAGVSVVDIPDWATHAVVSMTVFGAHFPGGDAYGDIWLQLGANSHADKQTGKRNGWNAFDSPGDSRQSIGASATFAIPASMRGTRQGVFPKATRTGGSNATAMRADYRTSFFGQVFFERRVI